MKFSLREVFDIHARGSVGSDETSSLLEAYGLLEESENVQHKSDDSLEEIYQAVNQILEGTNTTTSTDEMRNTSDKRQVNRDDLVLDRWRKMAGL
jgi:hypothetical protein